MFSLELNMSRDIWWIISSTKTSNINFREGLVFMTGSAGYFDFLLTKILMPPRIYFMCKFWIPPFQIVQHTHSSLDESQVISHSRPESHVVSVPYAIAWNYHWAISSLEFYVPGSSYILVTVARHGRHGTKVLE